MAEKVKLKFVGGQTYICPKIGTDIVRNGDVVEVDEDVAEFLLEDSWTDALGNVHPYFEEHDESAPKAKAKSKAKAKVEEDDGEQEPAADEDDEDSATAAPQRTRRAGK